MQYKNYLARKRARFEGICGHVNIPYGTCLLYTSDAADE